MSPNDTLKDYYAVLGVPPSATQDTIKKAFRALAAKYHPDINSDPGAEEHFKNLVEAYLILKSPDKRNLLDGQIISEFCQSYTFDLTKRGKKKKKKQPQPAFLRLLRGKEK